MKIFWITVFHILSYGIVCSQGAEDCYYRSYKLFNGDTVNVVDCKSLRQGKWVDSLVLPPLIPMTHHFEYYQNGQIIKTVWVENNIPQASFYDIAIPETELVIFYYSKGQVEYIGELQRGKLNGTLYYWSKRGKLNGIYQFTSGIVTKTIFSRSKKYWHEFDGWEPMGDLSRMNNP